MKRSTLRSTVIATTLSAFTVPATWGQVAPTGDWTPAPDVDARHAVRSKRAAQAKPLPAQQLVLDALGQRLPDLKVRWSGFTGSPRHLFSYDQPLVGPAPGSPRDIALGFLRSHRELFRLTPYDIADLRVVRDYVTKHNGVTHLTFQQTAGGLDVFGARILANVLTDGSLLSLGGEPLPRVRTSVNRTEPVLGPEAAVERAAKSVRLTIDGPLTQLDGSQGHAGAPSQLRSERAAVGEKGTENAATPADRGVSFAKGTTFARDVKAHLIYFPIAIDELRLAWETTLWETRSPNAYRVVVDAADGAILYRENLTQYGHMPAHGPVYRSDSPIPDTPTGSSTGEVPRVDSPFNGTEFFPHGDDHADWWNGSGEPDRTRTVSNNTTTKNDRDGDDDDTEGILTTGADEDFTFPVDLTMGPETYTSASVVNLFYWMNRLHDRYYRLGFDEAAGNFQVDNFGLGGTGTDPVQADSQDNADGAPPSNCNANMGTPADGGSPRLQMFECTNASPTRDGAFENLIVVHEFTHGVHKRLVKTSGNQRMNEGWSDFFGLSFLAEPGDDLNGRYPRGQWFYNNVNGNRRQPYGASKERTCTEDATKTCSSDADCTGSCLPAFTRTYGNLSDGARCSVKVCSDDATMVCADDGDCGGTCDSLSCTFDTDCDLPNTTIDQSPCNIGSPHRTGELWCESIYLARLNMVAKYGHTTGGKTINQLVIDAMKLSPDDPDFIDMRDMILLADSINNDGVNHCLIWDAFAKMGVGLSALSLDATDINPVEAFDTPAACSPNMELSGQLDFGQGCPQDFAVEPITITNSGTGELVVQTIFLHVSSDPDFTLESLPSLPVIVTGGSSIGFSVRFSATDTGIRTATVRITSNDPDIKHTDLALTGEGGEPDVDLSGSLNFGGIAVDDATEPHEATRTLTIYNLGDCALEIASVARIGGSTDFTVLTPPSFPLTLAAGAHVDVDVLFNPSSEGSKSATIRVTTDDPNTPTIDLPAVGKGLVPDIVAAPIGDVIFGPTVLGCGAESEQTITIQNLGQAELIITAISTTNPDFTVIGAAPPLRIAPSGSLDLIVRFDPSVVARRIDGFLEITSNDPDTPILSVALCGEGVLTGMRLLVVDPSGVPVPSITRLQLMSFGVIPRTNVRLTSVVPISIVPPVSCVPLAFHYETALTPTETSGLQGSRYSLRITVKDKGQPETRRVTFTLDACEYKELLLRVD